MVKNEETHDELVLTNQTEFGQEEPLFESTYHPPQPVSHVTPPPAKPQTKIWWIGGIVFSCVLVVFGLLAWLIQPMVQTQMQPPLVTSSPLPVSKSPMAERVDAVNAELQAADPTRPAFTFPQVEMNLFLDDPKARR